MCGRGLCEDDSIVIRIARTLTLIQDLKPEPGGLLTMQLYTSVGLVQYDCTTGDMRFEV